MQTNNKQNSNPQEPETNPNSYLRFMGLAGQMIAIILIGYGIGTFIEYKTKASNHIIVGLCSLVFTCIAMYVVIREIISTEKNN